LITVLVAGGVALAVFYLHQHPLFVANSPPPTSPEQPPPVATSTAVLHTPCLADNEYANYPLEQRNNRLGVPASSTIDVYVRTKQTESNIFSFKIGGIRITYHPPEFRPCGVYILREFGQGPHGGFPPGYRVELWRYDYSGIGTKLFTMFEVIGPNQEVSSYYSDDFRVDPAEHYLALDRGYQQSNEALVVKDVATLKNLFVLPLSDLAKQNPNVVGIFGLENGGWSKDGRYAWFNFSDSADPANTIGFVRVDTNNWSYKAFTAPQTTMGGDAFNPDTGMTTYNTNVAPWTADAQMDQMYRDKAKKEGGITSFYIYDLLIKRNYLVATTTDPVYYFRPQWISDTVLQYTLPSGATTTYAIPQ